MTNEELIKALRYCISDNADDCDLCPYQVDCKSNGTGKDKMIRDAADALEAAGKRIDELERNFEEVRNANGSLACERNKLLNDVRELEAQLPKEGEWIELDDPICYSKQCSVCGAAVRVCIGEMCTTAETYAKYCPKCGARMRGANDADN